MTDPIKVFVEEIPTGLFPTATARQSPFWGDGRNVVFEDGSIKAGLGQISMFVTETNDAILGDLTTIQDGKKTVYYATKTKLRKWTEADGVTDVTRVSGDYTGALSNLWSIKRFGDWVAASNGVDKVQLDKNDGNGFADMTTPFAWAKVLYTTDQQLIAMNTDFSPTDIEWTDIDDIENWTAAADNFAGAKEQRNLAGEITAAETLGAAIAVYTKNDFLTMAFIGSPFVFSILPQQEGFGASGLFAVCQKGGQQFGFGVKGLWVSDGVQFQRIGTPQVHQFIYGDSNFTVDLNYAHLAVVWHDQLQTSVTFYYTSQGNTTNNVGVSYNYTSNTWTVFNYGRTCVANEGIFDFAIAGDKQGNIFQQSVPSEPPTSGEIGFMDLTAVESIISSGYGEAGYGELGYGGEALIDG